MLRRLLVAALGLAVTGCSAGGPLSTPAASAGIVVVTAGGETVDIAAQHMPAALDLHISGSRALTTDDVKASLDGTTISDAAAADGSVTVTASPLPLASAHHLTITVAGASVFDSGIRIIDVTHVMAAVYAEGSGAALDLVFDDAPDQAAVARAISAPQTQWLDPSHLHLVWATAPPAALHLPATLAVAHGSHLAGAVDMAITPVPAVGSLRRVTVPAATPVPGLALTGYSVGTAASRASVAAHANQMRVVSPAGWRVAADGSMAGTPDATAVAAATAAGTAVMPLVQNDASNSAATTALLGSDNARGALVAAAVAAVRSGGYRGVELDIEGIDASDRDHFSALVTALAAGLHANGAVLDVDVVPHKPGHLNLYSAGYDISALTAKADHIVLMAYDQHTALTDAGPVAGLDWDNTLLDGTVKGVAASKVVLGIPLYSRTWTGGDAVSDGYQSSLSSALSVPGAVVGYDFAAATPSISFTAPGGAAPSVCYFDDAQSLLAKADLAQQRGYAGVAMWRLGFEDPAWWQAV